MSTTTNEAQKSQPLLQRQICFHMCCCAASCVSCLEAIVHQSKMKKITKKETEGKDQRKAEKHTRTHSQSYWPKVLFSKRCNHKWQEEGFCLWLLLLQTSKQVPSIAACFLVCSTSGHCKVLKKGQVVVSNGRPFEPLGLRIWHSAVKDIFVKVSKTLKIFYETSMPSSLSDMFSHAVNV